MAYPIRTIKAHKNAIEANVENLSKQIENQTDLGDGALSNWANSSMQQYHLHAIALLENGLEQVGIETPYSDFLVLFDADSNIISDKLISKDFFGKTSYSWVLNDEAAEKYKRKFVPSSDNSRIQKGFKMTESRIFKRAKPYLISDVAFVGGAVSFRAVSA